MIRKCLITINYSLFFCSLLSCWTNSDQITNNSSNSTDSIPEFTDTEVQIEVVKKNIFKFSTNIEGKIASKNDLTLHSEINGKAIKIYTHVGDKVSKGDTLIILDVRPILQKLKRAELVKFNNEKEYLSQLLGYENLLATKKQSEADTIRKKLRINSGLALSELDLEDLVIEKSKCYIMAPFNGIVSELNIQTGELASVGKELVRLFDPNNLHLESQILESELSSISRNTKAFITPIGNSNLILQGNVSQISPYVNENNLIKVNFKIENNTRDIFPGMNCMGIIDNPQTQVIAVDKKAIVIRNGKEVVFIAKGGRAKWNYVTTGRDNGKMVEIKLGVNDGDSVIVSNNLQLSHDAPIRIKNN